MYEKWNDCLYCFRRKGQIEAVYSAIHHIYEINRRVRRTKSTRIDLMQERRPGTMIPAPQVIDVSHAVAKADFWMHCDNTTASQPLP